MQLSHGTWYTLPDGTWVQAVEVNGDWQFEDEMGEPRYFCVPGVPNLYRLTYDPNRDVYDAQRCDITLDDLQREQERNA